jgi:hypothetical protein
MPKRHSGGMSSRLLAAVIFLVTAFPAWASLGGDARSIEADQVRMQGTRRMMAAQSYTVHEIQTATGTVVREYVSSQGTVFAVAWHGPWLPDLRQLLGSYFEQYARAAQSQNMVRTGRGPLLIDAPGLVVQHGGYSRSSTGRAYVPEMLPAGVHAEEIQ